MIGPPPACGRADLLRTLGRTADLRDEDRARVADVCGLVFIGAKKENSGAELARGERGSLPRPPSERAPPHPLFQPPLEPPPLQPPPAPLPPPQSLPQARFWQPYAMVELRSEAEQETAEALPSEYAGLTPLGPGDTGRRGAAPPPTPPLTPWRRLWPFLYAVLSTRRPLRAPALRRVIPRLAQGLPVRRLPLRTKARWSPSLLLLVDRDERLNLWMDDFLGLSRRLQRVRGDFGLKCVAAEAWLEKPEQEAARLSREGLRVLALSDLGCLEDDARGRMRWARLGRALRRRGVEAWALAPCPAECLALEVAEAWRIAEWNGRPPRVGGGLGGADDEGRARALAKGRKQADELLELLAPALRIESGLLRAAREALPAAPGERRSVAAEYWAWNHPALAGAGICARSPLEAEGRRWRNELAKRLAGSNRAAILDSLVKAVAMLRAWHGYCSPAVEWSELALLEGVLAAADCDNEATRARFAPAAVWEAGRAFQRRIVLGMRDGGTELAGPLAEWAEGQCQWLGEEALKRSEWRDTWVLKDRVRQAGVWALPEGVRTEDVAWTIGRTSLETARELVYHLRSGAWMVRSGLGPAPRRAVGEAPLARILTRRSELGVTVIGDEGPARRLRWPFAEADGAALLVDPTWRAMALETGREHLLVANEPRPSWAKRMGWDRDGLYADVELAEGVALRLRWIPPGRFWMGSPKDEVGRFENEGPRHEVTISSGFWLAATPITRAQWRAVMGGEAAQDDKPEEPVVDVNWAQVRKFGAELAERYPELVWELPSEAEWEYACRAGTEMAFNDGSACTVPDDEDPALEALKAAKRPNAWGLRQMHGSVWEWCLDGVRTYGEAVVLDPLGALDGGERVVRGGCSILHARFCRSAYRYYDHAGYRYGYLGFRLAAGQELQASDGARGLAAEAGRDAATKGQTRCGVRRARPWAQRFTRDEFGVRLEFTLETARDTPFVWRWIPRGFFTMGSPEDEVGRFDWEGPQHEVTITRGFWLGATAVTQAQWEAVLGAAANKSRFKGAERPVENVTWQQCLDYAWELNRLLPELGARLPSEAEWEYGCRAGTRSAYSDGSACTVPEEVEPKLEELGWYDKNSGRQTQPAGQKRANGWGLHDMHGNVWEWCADRWADSYSSEMRIDPLGPTKGDERVVRGGSWFNRARMCRSAFRDRLMPGFRRNDLGFRLAAGPALKCEDGARKERNGRRGEGAEHLKTPHKTHEKTRKELR